VVEGVVAATDRVTEEGAFRIVNLGESEPIRLSRLVEGLERATGREARIDRRPVPPGDVERTFADISRAREILDYDPRVDLETGLSRFVSWYREVMLPEPNPARAK
jgi:UDP-glucuronate 4-epimerase